MRRHFGTSLLALVLLAVAGSGHGTTVYPASRVYHVYQANPSNPSFQLAADAVAMDGELSYYTWNEVSRNVLEAVQAGLPPGFDYSPWMPDGALASAGRTDPASPDYPRTYAGLDQDSADWPRTPLVGGSMITVDFLATASHDPSVWDVWMTTPGWDPATPLTWSQLEFLGRPSVTLAGGHYTFDLEVPTDRAGHHVLWIAWQRDDPAGEVFVAASDVEIAQPFGLALQASGGGDLALEVTGVPSGAVRGYTLFSFDTAQPVGTGPFFGLFADAVTQLSLESPGVPGGPFHFVAPFAPGLYPNDPFAFPPGALAFLGGLTVDGIVGVLDGSGTVLEVSPVTRVTL